MSKFTQKDMMVKLIRERIGNSNKNEFKYSFQNNKDQSKAEIIHSFKSNQLSAQNSFLARES